MRSASFLWASLSLSCFVLGETIQTAKEIINILMPFIIGILIAFILNPVVRKISMLLGRFLKMKDKTPRKVLSIAIAYLLVIGMIAVVLFGIIPQIISSITDLVNYIPTAVNQIYHFVDNLEEHFPTLDMEVVRNTINNAIPDMINYVKDFATNIVPALYQVSMSILQWMLNLAIAIIVSIYMLSDKKILIHSMKAIVYAFVPVKRIPSTVEVLKEANHLFSSFIDGKAIDSTIIGGTVFSLYESAAAALHSADQRDSGGYQHDSLFRSLYRSSTRCSDHASGQSPAGFDLCHFDFSAPAV